MTCRRCGTVNRAGTTFCTSCGAPLVSADPDAESATSAGPPGTATLPLEAAAADVAADYRIHRLSFRQVLGIVLAIVLVATGIGSAQALRNQDVAPQHLAALASAPTAAGAVPTPRVSAPAGGEGNDVVVVEKPAGWSVQRNDSSDLVLRGPDGLIEWYTVSSVPAGTTVETVALDDVLQAEHIHAQANLCENPVRGAVQNGPSNALLYGVCYTLAAQAGAAVPVEQMHETALVTATDGSGLLLFEIVTTCPRSQCDAFVTGARPVLASTVWSQLP